MNRCRHELLLFLSAVEFLTRLPIPGWVGWSDDRMIRASRYFALVGALIGLAGGVVWWTAVQVLPPTLAAGLTLLVTTILTGALHEDGLADCADGLGGGKTGSEALDIMRDSRVGSYGAMSLVFSIGLRWAALSALSPVAGVFVLAMAGGIGRALMVPATALANYARHEGVGTGIAGGAKPIEIAAAMGTALLLAIAGGWAGLLALALAISVASGFLIYMTRRVGGYTGDGLGTIAQLGEIAVMVTLAGAWA